MNQTSFLLRDVFRTYLLMAVAGFATLQAQRPMLAGEITVVGTNGNNGSDGVDGAANGQNGGDGQSVTLTNSDDSGGITNAIATGGNGGNGGKGFGDAGNGGDGGRGGNASATATGSAASMKASATGGDSGVGGKSGVSSPRSTGFSGSGGGATATVRQTNGVLAEAIAKGGFGGVYRVPMTDGVATSSVQSNSTIGSVEGRSIAIGGDGRDASMADREIGTMGGGAIADLSIWGTTGASGYATATAGNTGTVEERFGDSRGNGARASGVVITNAGLADLTLIAKGGRGGDSIGSADAGTGGGGIASGGVFSTDQVRLNLTQTGGDGGNALGTGRGGDGAEVETARLFYEAIDSAAHTGEFHITSVGGNGGESNTISGQGGDVYFDLSGGSVSFATSLEIEINSIGGSGGFAHNGGVANRGGHVESRLDSSNSTGGIESINRAIGGQGGNSEGGASLSGGSAFANLGASGMGSKVSGSAHAYGGLGGGRQDLNGTAGDGGYASSSGFVSGGDEASLYAKAVGGNGGSSANSNGGNGGNASASGVIVSSGTSAKIEIYSTGGNGGVGGGTGNGGQAGTAAFTVQSSALQAIRSANVTIGAYVTGGNGGGALGTGRGANGGSINLNNATNTSGVQGAKTLAVTQSATGGNGGFASDSAALAGKGGNANSSLSLSGSYSNSLTVATEAKGGHGGDNLAGIGGAGGSATSYSSATNSGNAIATAQSSAGSGGTGSGGISAVAGTATATAISRSDGRAVAEASSFGKTANSDATTSGIDGYAKASSQTWSPSNIIVSTSAQASTGLLTHVATMASNEGAIFSHNLDDLAAYSVVWSEPTIDASSFVSANDLNQITTIALAPSANTQTLSSGEFGGNYSDAATPDLVQTQSIQTILGFDGTSMLGKKMFVGLHDGQMSGFTDASDSWSFTIQSRGSGFLQTWDSTGGLAFADLFRDNLISLGLYSNLNWQDLVLSASWNINGEDDSLVGKFFISSSVAAVPEPSMLLLGSLAATLYVGRNVRSRKKQRVNR